jgi:hypothetical protein
MTEPEKEEARKKLASADFSRQSEMLQELGIMTCMVTDPIARTPDNPFGWMDVTKGNEQ